MGEDEIENGILTDDDHKLIRTVAMIIAVTLLISGLMIWWGLNG